MLVRRKTTRYSLETLVIVAAENSVFLWVATMASPAPSIRGLIQFDLSSAVPSGVTITSATLTMYLEMANNATARTIDLHPVNVAWGEGTAGARNAERSRIYGRCGRRYVD